MIHFSDIEINKFQLNTLLNQQEKQGLKYQVQNDICCSSCESQNPHIIKQYKLFLDRFNDIKVKGTCESCGTIINHVVPFGHSESFFRKAIQFRHKIAVATES